MEIQETRSYEEALIKLFQKDLEITHLNANTYSEKNLEDVMRRIMDHSSQKLHELLPDQWILTQ
jgi:hypothetical protein